MPVQYSKWAPTQFDCKGLGLEDQQDWLVVGVCRTRDSGPLDESNFSTALSILREADTTGEHVETHRFGHWGPGWYEVILVHPSLEAEADKIESALADYPALDDSDFSERESEAEWEAWQWSGHKGFIEALVAAFDLQESTQTWLEDKPSHEDTWALYNRFVGTGPEHHSDGVYFYEERCAQSPLLSRDVFAAWIKCVRAGKKEAPRAGNQD